MDEKLYHECYESVCQTRGLFEELSRWGFDRIPVPEIVSLPPVKSVKSLSVISQTKSESMDDLRIQLQDCTLCELSRERNRVVIGRGNPQAELVFVGEAPGREEDQQGQPFVGEAGRLLDRIIFAMGLSSDEIYICNLIKCRPPNNRDPQADEIATCEPFLQRQLAIIKPQVIVALGRFAAQTLLATAKPISKMRGQWYSYENIALMPTYHPAYLLRSPAEKKWVWEDMKQVMARLSGKR